MLRCPIEEPIVHMNYSLKKLILWGVGLEIVIFLVAYFLTPSISESFRLAARYSGRLSALVFLFTFFLFASSYPAPVADNKLLRSWVSLFALLHVIHFGFLASNVYLNSIPLEAPKVAGGALAYLMIIGGPFFLYRVKLPLQLTYFYYVSLVMILTYVARIKGDFEGAEPYWLHYVALGILLASCIGFGWRIGKRKAHRME